ncbi:hypothetical protein R1flu_008574 [Riccia fluitans]|uniref:Secreted protein n=1 Tax=Riccia fluitans TaxID=41844 RepID=A0ABD1YC30_9MARC
MTTVVCEAAMESGVLTIACIIAFCPDARSTGGPPPIVTGTGSLVAPLIKLTSLSNTGLYCDFLDLIFRRWIINGDSSSVTSSSIGSYHPRPCGGVTSTAIAFFLTGCPGELDDSLQAAA